MMAVKVRRLKPLLQRRNPPPRVRASMIESAEADFATVDAVLTASRRSFVSQSGLEQLPALNVL